MRPAEELYVFSKDARQIHNVAKRQASTPRFAEMLGKPSFDRELIQNKMPACDGPGDIFDT